jgi:hypothetical protein
MAATSLGGTVVRFPRSRKPGSKVTTGPAAGVTAFPVLTGAALASQWNWLSEAQDNWEIGADDPVDNDAVWDIARVRRAPEPQMRAEVANWRSRLAKRDALKAWLTARGLEAGTAEDAAFMLFDMLRMERLG